MVTAIGGVYRANIKGAGRVVIPGGTGEGRLVCVTQLASGEDGMGCEVKGKVVKAMIGTECGVGVPWLEVIKC